MRKGNIALTIIGLVILVIAFLFWYGSTQTLGYHDEMLKKDCYPLGVEWNEEKQDYDKWPPTGWDCSRDVLGENKFEHLPK